MILKSVSANKSPSYVAIPVLALIVNAPLVGSPTILYTAPALTFVIVGAGKLVGKPPPLSLIL